MSLHEKLHQIGFTKLEARVYETLLKSEGLTAKEVAGEVKVLAQSASRTLNSLVRKGVVISIDSHPAMFQVLPLSVGISKYLESMTGQFAQIFGDDSFSSRTPFSIITDRTEYHRVGEREFKKAQKEVLVIASGAGDLSADFTKTMVDAVREGVVYKILSLTFGEVNREQLKNWKKNGFLVRYRPGQGVNLVIYDRATVQMGFRIEPDSREKYGIFIHNLSLGSFLGEFYDFLWDQSSAV